MTHQATTDKNGNKYKCHKITLQQFTNNNSWPRLVPASFTTHAQPLNKFTYTAATASNILPMKQISTKSSPSCILSACQWMNTKLIMMKMTTTLIMFTVRLWHVAEKCAIVQARPIYQRQADICNTENIQLNPLNVWWLQWQILSLVDKCTRKCCT